MWLGVTPRGGPLVFAGDSAARALIGNGAVFGGAVTRLPVFGIRHERREVEDCRHRGGIEDKVAVGFGELFARGVRKGLGLTAWVEGVLRMAVLGARGSRGFTDFGEVWRRCGTGCGRVMHAVKIFEVIGAR